MKNSEGKKKNKSDKQYDDLKMTFQVTPALYTYLRKAGWKIVQRQSTASGEPDDG